MLTVGTFNLAMWMFWAILTVFGFVSSLKKMTERATERYCARRRRRIARKRERAGRERVAQAARLAKLAFPAEEPTVIYSNAPGTGSGQLPTARPIPVTRALGGPDDPGQGPPFIATRSFRSNATTKATPEPIETTVLSFRGAPRLRAGSA